MQGSLQDVLPRLGDVLVLLPGAGAAALLLIAGSALGRRHEGWIAPVLAGTALGIGQIATWVMSHDGFPFLPRASTERMLYAVPAVGLLAAVLPHDRASLRWTGRTLLAAGLLVALVYPLLRRPADGVGVLDLLLPVAGSVGAWAALSRLHEKSDGPSVPLAAAMALAAAGQVFVIHGAATLGQLTGTSGMALGTVGLLRWIGVLPRIHPAAVGGLVAAAAAVGFDAHYYLVDPPSPLVLGLLVASPLAAAAGLVERVRGMHPLPRVALPLLLAAVPLAIALGLAFSGAAAAEADPYGDETYPK